MELARSAVRGRLIAAEVVDELGMRLVREVYNLPYPLSMEHPLFLLLEVADGGDGSGFVEQVLEGRDVVVGLDADEIQRLWRYREGQADAFASLGVIHKLDVSVPLEHLPACAAELRETVGSPADVQALGIFGHVMDGNLHVEFVGPDVEDETVDIVVMECIARYGGSISAEHGIGRLKAPYLQLSRTPEEIAAMRSIKNAWDPRGLMNPGVLFS